MDSNHNYSENKFNVEFRDIINTPFSIYNKNSNEMTLLQYICANKLYFVMEFIIKMMGSYNSFKWQDDDGNTPLHLLCKNIDSLEEHHNTSGYPFSDDHNLCYDFSSRPLISISLTIMKDLSNYVDFSIRNKEGKTVDELTNNIFVHHFYCQQQFKKKGGKFPSTLTVKEEEKYYYQAYDQHWCDLFRLKDTKRKNKTLMHFLCDGDRLGAIQFLLEHGADINKENHASTSFGDMSIGGKVPLSFLFSKFHNYNYCIPSGFYDKDKFYVFSNGKCLLDRNKLLCNPKQFMEENFNKTEKWIYNETEKIVAYFIQQGADLSLDEGLNLPSFSDIVYQLTKKENCKNWNSINHSKEEESKTYWNDSNEREKERMEMNQERNSPNRHRLINEDIELPFRDKIINIINYIKKNVDTPEFHEKVNKNSKKIIITLSILMVVLTILALLLTVLMMVMLMLASKVIPHKI